MSSETYNMSFTTGGLFLKESIQVTNLYLRLGEWEAVRREVFDENILLFRDQDNALRFYGHCYGDDYDGVYYFAFPPVYLDE